MKKVNEELQEMEINKDLAFFSMLFPEKLQEFLDLTHFDEIQHFIFQEYLKFCRSIVEMQMKISKEINWKDSDDKKQWVVKAGKESVPYVIHLIELAFEYYLGNKDILTKEEI
ncbi:MAG: hypothetical protein ACHQF0_12800 [Chitinophagales bacterium]